MAKSKVKAAPTPAEPTANVGKRSAAAEIDDIFSAKKPKLALPPPAETGAVVGGKKKKGKKSKAELDGAGEVEESGSKAVEAVKEQPAVPPKRVPVEVHDTSKAIESYKPEAAPMATKVLGPDATEAEKKAAEEEERFMDSRGSRTFTHSPSPLAGSLTFPPVTQDARRTTVCPSTTFKNSKLVWEEVHSSPARLSPDLRTDSAVYYLTETEQCPFDCDCCTFSAFSSPNSQN